MGERIGVWPREFCVLSILANKKRPEAEFALNARIQLARRSTGSRNFPAVLLVDGVEASVSRNTAVIIAFMSPRTPCPLLAKAAATRST